MRHTPGPAHAALLLTVLSPLAYGDDSPTRPTTEDPALSPRRSASSSVTPPGFEVELVASEPDIRKPMNIAFDDRGRLWVTDTIEYPFPVKEARRAGTRSGSSRTPTATAGRKKVTVFASV